MSPTAPAATEFIDHLRRILPPARVLHVGAGTGAGAMHAWRAWRPDTAWLIDADPAALEWLQAPDAAPPGWHVRAATLADETGDVDFHHASNPAESGLIPPAALRTLWPNLAPLGSERRHAVTLDSLVDSVPAGPHGDWLLVDCLTAPAILRGAARTLEQCSVAWLRTLAEPLPGAAQGGTLAQLRDMLEPLGWRRVHVGECNHPAIVEVVFVRDWRAGPPAPAAVAHATDDIAALRRQLAEQADLLTARQERLLRLQQTLGAQQTEMEQLAQRHEQETVALRDELAAVRDGALQAQRKREEREAQAEQASEAGRTLTAAHAALQTETAHLREQLDAAHAAQERQSAEYARERQARQAELADRDGKLQQREADIALLTTRQRQLDDELLRAEAQIDLIKDVLLREQRA